MYDVHRGTPVRLGQQVVLELRPVWSPDDREIVFERGLELVIKAAEGGDERRLDSVLVDAHGVADLVTDWSGAHNALVVEGTSSELDASRDLHLYSLTNEATTVLVATEFNETMGRVSPDGKWLAYLSDESGEVNLFVRPLFGSGGAVRISSSGGLDHQWREDGRELFYVQPGGKVMAVPIAAGRRLDVGEPMELFRFASRGLEGLEQIAVADNGQRFLVLERIGYPPPLTLIQNWTVERSAISCGFASIN